MNISVDVYRSNTIEKNVQPYENDSLYLSIVFGFNFTIEAFSAKFNVVPVNDWYFISGRMPANKYLSGRAQKKSPTLSAYVTSTRTHTCHKDCLTSEHASGYFSKIFPKNKSGTQGWDGLDWIFDFWSIWPFVEKTQSFHWGSNWFFFLVSPIPPFSLGWGVFLCKRIQCCPFWSRPVRIGHCAPGKNQSYWKKEKNVSIEHILALVFTKKTTTPTKHAREEKTWSELLYCPSMLSVLKVTQRVQPTGFIHTEITHRCRRFRPGQITHIQPSSATHALFGGVGHVGFEH